MASPVPKHPEQRRRRNEPTRGEWQDLEPLEKSILPQLPTPPEDEDWRSMTRMTWDAWRMDPVTQTWSHADVAYALDTIVMHNRLTAKTAAEVRLRMDGLGLTPKGKRDLRLRIVKAQVEAEIKKPATVHRLKAVS